MKRGIVLLFGILMIFGVVNLLNMASAEEVSVCCEKTSSGLYCQDVPSNECAPNSKQTPTSCDSTSYCKAGYCYDSTEGTVSDNVPQLVCNANGGIWSETRPPQAELGCCLLGDQAAFVSLVRCKRLSSFLGLQTNYNKAIKDETQCILSVQNQDKGACVFESEFERTCKFTTRSECNAQGGNTTAKGGVEFYVGKLCSADELGTNCGPTRETTCLPGKDGVYFVDSCGNPANVYDASKINDKEYWTNLKDVSEACNPNSDNANSQGCGNCNYLLGSVCRPTSSETAKPTYGENICANLNCKDTSNGKSYRHGESWCVKSDEGVYDEANNAAGSRFFRHLCINGEEVVEQCADFRQEECTEDIIETSLGDFSQAACTVNRWQDCLVQDNKKDCENTDRRDCLWKPGLSLQTVNRSSASAENGLCVPRNTPGLKFWEGEQAKSICAQANYKCVVTFEKGLFGGEKCVDNCECLEDSWEKERAEICMAIGDCGPKINWLGEQGYKEGFAVTIGKAKSKK